MIPWVGKIPWRRAMATHSSILAWRISWTEEAGYRVGYRARIELDMTDIACIERLSWKKKKNLPSIGFLP